MRRVVAMHGLKKAAVPVETELKKPREVITTDIKNGQFIDGKAL